MPPLVESSRLAKVDGGYRLLVRVAPTGEVTSGPLEGVAPRAFRGLLSAGATRRRPLGPTWQWRQGLEAPSQVVSNGTSHRGSLCLAAMHGRAPDGASRRCR